MCFVFKENLYYVTERVGGFRDILFGSHLKGNFFLKLDIVANNDFLVLEK